MHTTKETRIAIHRLIDAVIDEHLTTPRALVEYVESVLEEAGELSPEEEHPQPATLERLRGAKAALQDEHDATLALVSIAAEANGEWRKARQHAFVDLVCRLPRVTGIGMARHIENVREAAREAFEAKRLPQYEAWVLGLSGDGGPPTGGHEG